MEHVGISSFVSGRFRDCFFFFNVFFLLSIDHELIGFDRNRSGSIILFQYPAVIQPNLCSDSVFEVGTGLRDGSPKNGGVSKDLDVQHLFSMHEKCLPRCDDVWYIHKCYLHFT